jgi:hypothetical protein
MINQSINQLGQEKVAAKEVLELIYVEMVHNSLKINKPESPTIITVLKQRVHLRL